MNRTLWLVCCVPLLACAPDAPPPDTAGAAGEAPATAPPSTSLPPATTTAPSQATSPGSLPATPDAAPRTFVFLQQRAGGGVDTLGFEQFSREARLLRGELRSPGGLRTAYAAELAGDGRVLTVEVRGWAPGAPATASPDEVARGTFRGDSLIGTVTQAGGSGETRVKTAEGALPYLSPSVGLMEQLLWRSRALGGDAAEIPVFLLRGDGNTFLGNVTWVRPDSAILRVGGSEGHLVVDGDLRIVRGTNPAAGTRFERVR